MMKKFIFLVICFFCLCNGVWAADVKCPEVVSPGEEFVIRVDDNEYRGIKAKYNFGDGFVYQRISLRDKWKSYYDGVKGFSVGNVSNDEGLGLDIRVKVGNEVSVNKEYSLGLSEIEVSDRENRYVKLNDVSCKVKVLSDINSLNSLVVEGVVLSPKFDKNVVSYKGITKNEKVNIGATASDVGARIEGDIGERSLKIGVNTFVVRVISARGSIREYKLYITRESKSNDVALKSLKLSNGELKFKSDVFFYEVNVSNEIDNIEVEAVARDKMAGVRVEKPEVLVVGDNEIKVVVTAEDGSSATYVVVVKRGDKLSGDASIKSLVIKNYELNFKSDIYEYDLEIDGEDKLDIEVVLNNDKASYVIRGNKDLKHNSIIEIEVKAEDGSTSIYKIIIRKLGSSNSSTITNYIKLIPLIGFVLLVIGVLVIKLVKTIITKFSK